MNTVTLTQDDCSLHNYLESDSEEEEKYDHCFKRQENFRSVSQNVSAASSYEDNLDNLDHLENFNLNGCQRPFLINHLPDLSTRSKRKKTLADLIFYLFASNFLLSFFLFQTLNCSLSLSLSLPNKFSGCECYSRIC